MTNLMVAYARFSEPQIPMSMYIGISTISKNAKKSSRSSARNTPSRPVSRMSIATMNCFGRSLIDLEAASASGNRIVVSTTIHSEIPSTPHSPTDSQGLRERDVLGELEEWDRVLGREVGQDPEGDAEGNDADTDGNGEVELGASLRE